MRPEVRPTALAMFGLPTGVPAACYGPGGFAEAVTNIRASIAPGVPAVPLANSGVLLSIAPQSWPSWLALVILVGRIRRGGCSGRSQCGQHRRVGGDP